MIRLKGLEPGRDIQLVYTGLRPGEKMHEELVGPHEKLLHTHHKKIMLVEGTPAVARDELVSRIEQLASTPPKSREEVAARLQALARLDLRDGAPATTGTTVDAEAP
jgi:FlaA1/EpsC-like NDP-sugar epimerase